MIIVENQLSAASALNAELSLQASDLSKQPSNVQEAAGIENSKLAAELTKTKSFFKVEQDISAHQPLSKQMLAAADDCRNEACSRADAFKQNLKQELDSNATL